MKQKLRLCHWVILSVGMWFWMGIQAKAQESTFVFEATNAGDFAVAHSGTDFSTYEQTTLKVTGPLNGDDINRIRNAVSTHFTELDLGEAKITSEGQYTGNGNTYEMQEDTIGQYMFSRLANLNHIVFPAGLKCIGNYAFYCPSSPSCLLSVELPASVRSIGQMAFSYNRLTEGVTLNE